MSTIIKDVCAAVVTQLNTGSFSQEFTAERKWKPDFKLEELETLRVTASVDPENIRVERASRGATRWTIPVKVLVQVKLGRNYESETDGYVELLEEIVAELAFLRLSDKEDAIPMSLDPLMIFGSSMRDDVLVFVGSVTANYRVNA